MHTNINGVFRFTWLAYSFNQNPEKRAQLITKAKERIHDFDEAYKTLSTSQITDKARDILKRIEPSWAKTSEVLNQFYTLLGKNTAADDEEARKLLHGNLEITSAVMEGLREIGGIVDEKNKAIAADARVSASQAITITIVGGVIGILSTLIFGSLIGYRLVSSLSKISSQISEGGREVNSGSTQLSMSSQQLSSGATEAAASLEETVASIEELSSQVKVNADNAKSAANLSQNSRHSAEQGEKEIQSLISSMQDISQSSRKIEEIINVIDDIAFQTNLLALNAAVEAARAGDQGRGFAVVADAVRTLAQRSSAAAKDINSLIRDSVDKIEAGRQGADKSGTVLKEIVASVKQVADLVNEIATSSHDQSSGISQIGKAMNQLDQATQGNAAAAEEVAASSEELTAQATMMDQLVEELMGIINGQNGGGAVNGETPSSVQSAKKVSKTDAAKVIPFGPATAASDTLEKEGFGKVGNIDGF